MYNRLAYKRRENTLNTTKKMPSRYQEMLKNQRQNAETARAGLAWENGEEDRLLNMLFEGSTYEQVAQDLKRTEGSIKTRLYSILCRQVDAGDETLQSVYDKYKVSSDDLEDFRMKKKAREEKLQERMKNRRNKRSTVSNSDAPASQNTGSQNTPNNLLGHILDLKRDVYAIKQYFKIH